MDPIAFPLAQQLLECFCLQLAQEGDDKPTICCLRVGEEVAYGLSTTQDECCSGLSWVRITGLFPTGGGFPEEGGQVNRCTPDSWGVELEMGVARCAPVGDASTLPTCVEWTETARLLAEDAAAMRRAILCCFQSPTELFSVGRWVPFGPEGMCVGGVMTVTVLVDACNECV